MIPLAVPNLSGNEARYLQDCVQTNYVSSVGPFVDRFEDMVANAAENSRAVATSCGTTGLHVALTALGVGRDDLVILPSLTFIASANAIAHCGAAPWLLDIDPDTWTLDPLLFEEVLRDQAEIEDGVLRHRGTRQRVAAVMPVYTLGLPGHATRIADIGHAYGLVIVADAAAALGATSRGRPVGALGADLTVFSFNGNKTVTAGGGGAVAGDDDTLLDLVRHLTTTARTGPDYHHDRVGFNYRMTNLQAAVGCAQLEQLDAFVAAKRRIAQSYNAALTDLAGVSAFPEPAPMASACWFSGVTVAAPPARHGVAELLPMLRGEGIGARPFWKPIHLQPPYRDAPATPMPVCEALWETILCLPCSTGLSEAEQDRVVAVLRNRLGVDASTAQ